MTGRPTASLISRFTVPIVSGAVTVTTISRLMFKSVVTPGLKSSTLMVRLMDSGIGKSIIPGESVGAFTNKISSCTSGLYGSSLSWVRVSNVLSDCRSNCPSSVRTTRFRSTRLNCDSQVTSVPAVILLTWFWTAEHEGEIKSPVIGMSLRTQATWVSQRVRVSLSASAF